MSYCDKINQEVWQISSLIHKDILSPLSPDTIKLIDTLLANIRYHSNGIKQCVLNYADVIGKEDTN